MTNTIIFTIGRMNPPTPGHLELIKKIIYTAIAEKVNQVYVFITSTNDGPKNPISCPEKIAVLGDEATSNTTNNRTMINSLKLQMESEDNINSASISNLTVNVICIPQGTNTFAPLRQVVKTTLDAQLFANVAPNIKIIGVFGEDQAASMTKAIDAMVFNLKFDEATQSEMNWPGLTSKIIPVLRPGMDDLIASSNNPGAVSPELNPQSISSSFVRNIVKNGQYEEFKKLYLPFLDEDKILALYKSILQGLTIKKVTVKRKQLEPTDGSATDRKRRTQKQQQGGKQSRKSRKLMKTRRKHKRRTTKRS